MADAPPVPEAVDTSHCETLIELLRLRADAAPAGLAYVFLQDGEEEAGRRTFGELDRRARTVAAALQDRVGPGHRALLLYPTGLDYLDGFFGCLYAGIVPVPAYPPRQNRSLDRLRSIREDAHVAVTLATTGIRDASSRHGPNGAEDWICTDSLPHEAGVSWREPHVGGGNLALLQYTSGATGRPKGVMVSHGNLLANERMIQRALGHTAESTFVSWLPIYHDMGLIGNLLQPLYVGASCVLMSPAAFLQKPVRWLRAITDYGGRTSGAPDFAYGLCAERVAPEDRETLDLAGWRVAYSGAEPVRYATLERFTTAFQPCGFRREAFWPCYGLAEATLLVTGGPRDGPPVVHRFDTEGLSRGKAMAAGEGSAGARALVGCGRPAKGVDVAIVAPESRRGCVDGRIGEVWVRGPGVAQGYWNRTVGGAEASFSASRADTGEGPYLRTGDLGFLWDGELFLTGRLKDLIIVRGRNHYPQDIERTVEACHPGLRAGGAAAFGVEIGGEERLGVFAEVERHHHRDLDVQDVVSTARMAIGREHELDLYSLVLLRPGRLPKTSSGKRKRHACRDRFLAGEDDAIAEWRGPDRIGTGADAAAKSMLPEPTTLEDAMEWMRAVLAAELRVGKDAVRRDEPLVAQGVDSIAATVLCHRVESTLGVPLSPGDIVDGRTLEGLVDHVWALRDRETTLPMPTARVTRSGPAQLSRGQEALWFLHQVDPDGSGLNIARAVRVVGDLNVTALSSAVRALGRRHDALRTRIEPRAGGPHQRVLPNATIPLEVADARDWDERRLRQELDRRAGRPFDLASDALFRLTLLRRGTGEAVLLLCAHHIVTDLWSLATLMAELGTLYESADRGTAAYLPPVPLQPADYAVWETALLASPRGDQLRDFWNDYLEGGIPPLDLPVDRQPALGGGPGRGATERFRLDPGASERVRELARGHGATLYTTGLAALAALLHRYTGREQFVAGSVVSGRSRAGLDRLVGYLVNPVAIRADVRGREPFSELLRKTREHVAAALRHQEYPFSMVVEALHRDRSVSRFQVLQVMFVFQRAHLLDAEGLTKFAVAEPGSRMAWAGLTLESLELAPGPAPYDLTFTMADTGASILVTLHYSEDLFDIQTARRIGRHFQSILQGAAADPGTAVSDLPLPADGVSPPQEWRRRS